MRTTTHGQPIEVAQVVTRCIAGAGGVALRGALHLDPERYRVTFVTGEGGPLTDRARDAGMRVLLEPSLVPEISPRDDRQALRRMTRLFHEQGFDVVHTHSAKAGVLGRMAAYRARVPVVVHTYHGFPFHAFQSPARRAAYVAVERALAPLTDVTLAIGTGVATEALRRGLARPGSLRTIAPVVEGDSGVRSEATRAAARHLLDLPADGPVVGTVGRVDFQKAPEHLIAAARRLRTTTPSSSGWGAGRCWTRWRPSPTPRDSATGSASSGSATTSPRCSRPSTSSRWRAATRGCRAPSSRRCGAGSRWSRRP